MGELCLILVTPNFTTIIYTYPLINIFYLVEPLGNFNSKLPWHIYIHIHAGIL